MKRGPARRRQTFGRAFFLWVPLLAVAQVGPGRAADAAPVAAEDEAAQVARVEKAGESLVAASDAYAEGRFDDAARRARQALDEVDGLLPGTSAFNLLATFFLGASLNELGRYAEAQPVLEALERDFRTAGAAEGLDLGVILRFRTHNAYWLDRSAEAIAKGAELEAWVREHLGTDGSRYAVARYEYGAALMLGGKPAEAEPHLAAAVDLFWRQADPADRAPAVRAMTYQGRVTGQLGRLAEADALFREAVARAEGLFGPSHAETAAPLADRAQNLTNMGRFVEARAILARVLDIEMTAYGADSLEVAATRNNIALNLETQGRFAEAAPLFAEALATYARLLGETHQQTLLIATNAAVNTASQGDFADAERRFAAIAAAARSLGEDNPMRGIIEGNRAMALAGLGRLSEAEAMTRRAIRILTATVGDRHPQTINGYQTLAAILISQGRREDAIPIHQRALELAVATLGRDHQQVSLILTNMCENFAALDAAQQAEPLARTVLEIEARIRGPEGVYVAKARDLVATMMRRQGRAAEAVPEYRAALAMMEKATSPDHPLVGRIALNLAIALEAAGAVREAEPLYRRAVAIREHSLTPDHYELMASYAALGTFLLRARGAALDALPPLRNAGAIARRLGGSGVTDDAARANFDRSRDIFKWQVEAQWKAAH